MLCKTAEFLDLHVVKGNLAKHVNEYNMMNEGTFTVHLSKRNCYIL